MSNINEELISLHGSPAAIQSRILSGMENRYGDGAIVCSPCNVASHLIEAIAVTGSDLVQEFGRNMMSVFPKRISNAEDLYNHMSDYDHAGINGAPASTEVEITMLLDTVLETSKIYSTPYDPDDDEEETTNFSWKTTIPKYSKFEIGGVTFSTYYPIDIHVKADSINIGTYSYISVQYDTSEINPLSPYITSILDHTVFSENDIDILSIKLPVYQTTRESTSFEVFGESAFRKELPYNKFAYGTRVFTNRKYDKPHNAGEEAFITLDDGTVWTELHQVLESNIYDVVSGIPTVVVQNNMLEKSMGVTIPQIFLTEGRIGTKIMVDVYSTNGAITMDIGDDIDKPIVATFAVNGNVNQDKFYQAVYREGSLNAYPLKSRIVGGTDGLDFETVRNRVIYDTPGNHVKVSLQEISQLYKEHGFTISMFKDGITNRIYYASRDLKDLGGHIIPSGELMTVLDVLYINRQAAADDKIHGVSIFNDGSMTITPQALFEYDKLSSRCIPLTASQYKARLITADVANRIDYYNSTNFTMTPFHTTLHTTLGTAIANTYNLYSPDIYDIRFMSNNKRAMQIYLTSAIMIHSDPVAADDMGTYELRMYVQAVDEISMDDIVASLSLPKAAGASSISVIEYDEEGGYFKTRLATQYKFNEYGQIGLFFDGAKTSSSYYDLETKNAQITFTWDSNGSTATSEYTATLKFGEVINDIHNVVNMTATDKDFAAHETGVVATRIVTEYERDPGTGEYVINGLGKLSALYGQASKIEKGDPVQRTSITQSNFDDFYDAEVTTPGSSGTFNISGDGCGSLVEFDTTYPIVDGQTVQQYELLHKRGDIMLDEHGEVSEATRSYRYNVNIIHLSAKERFLNFSDEVDDVKSYTEDARNTVLGYCSDVNGSKHQLLQNTNIYFSPKRSIGQVMCKSNKPYHTMHDLELDISLRLHVTRHVAGNEDEQLRIKNIIIDIFDKHGSDDVFSLSKIVNIIVNTLIGAVMSIDVLSVNGITDIQTITPVDSDIVLGLKHRLTIDKTNQNDIVSERALDLEFSIVGNN